MDGAPPSLISQFFFLNSGGFGTEGNWSGRGDLNSRPPEPHSGALPGCATARLDADRTTLRRPDNIHCGRNLPGRRPGIEDCQSRDGSWFGHFSTLDFQFSIRHTIFGAQTTTARVISIPFGVGATAISSMDRACAVSSSRSTSSSRSHIFCTSAIFAM